MRSLQAAVVLAVLVAAGTSAQAPLTVISKGNMSGHQTARQVVVRTLAEWKALWNEHSATEKMPAVDFGSNMVVGVFLGTKPSDGYTVDIVAVRPTDKEVVVEFVQKQPGRGTMAAQILTEPYHLVSVPKHTGTVRFVQLPDPGTTK
jgi:hypothetical protein